MADMLRVNTRLRFVLVERTVEEDDLGLGDDALQEDELVDILKRRGSAIDVRDAIFQLLLCDPQVAPAPATSSVGATFFGGRNCDRRLLHMALQFLLPSQVPEAFSFLYML